MHNEVRPRVVVVDDEQSVRELVEIGLVQKGFEVRTAVDGSSGLALIRHWDPEAIVLDVMMPVIDGLSLIPLIRRVSHAPIIVLTARSSVGDRVAGLRAGADDYIVKPFELVELAERLHAALRRPFLASGERLRYSDVLIDLETRSARRSGRHIELSTREFDLAATFVRQPRRVFTRDELIELVWGMDRDVTRNTVDTYISYLRSKLDAPPAKPLIHTVRGVGYTMREEYDR
jgi:DNA-binding response OmpR family regulator